MADKKHLHATIQYLPLNGSGSDGGPNILNVSLPVPVLAEIANRLTSSVLEHERIMGKDRTGGVHTEDELWMRVAEVAQFLNRFVIEAAKIAEQTRQDEVEAGEEPRRCQDPTCEVCNPRTAGVTLN